MVTPNERLIIDPQVAINKVSYTASRHRYHLIIDDVPAWVCRQCGEPLFDEETVETIQAMLTAVDRHRRRLTTLANAA